MPSVSTRKYYKKMPRTSKKAEFSRFRAVPGFPGIEVTNDGRVRSWWRWGAPGEGLEEPRLLVPSRSAKGYDVVSVRHETWAKPRSVGVHRLVLTAFDRPPKRGETARHKKGRRNHIKNLRWVPAGVVNGINRKAVRKTRKLSPQEAAEAVGCSVASIYRIRKELGLEAKR